MRSTPWAYHATTAGRYRPRVAGCPPGQVTCGTSNPGDPPVCCPAGDDPGFFLAESYENVGRSKQRLRKRRARRAR